jgi:hypothetical protein
MRRLWPVASILALLLAATALADPPPAHFKSILVRFTVGNDGVVHVAERVDVDAPGEIIERSYWSDDEQRVTVQKITGPDGTAVKFESPWPSKITWHGASGSYLIESTISDAVIPAWSIPRASAMTHDESRMISDPRERLRAIIPIWREARGHWRSRYLLDFQYEMPPPSEEGTDIQLQLFWPDGWSPVHPISGNTIATKIPFDTYNSTRWRVMHPFDTTTAKLDVRKHEIRMAAIVAFPVACLLLWLLFVIRELFRRGTGSSGEEVDERVLRETLYNEPPEIIAARWGRPTRPRIEAFLRRLEKQRKLALTIENIAETDDSDADVKVNLRLLVAREQLTGYERAGIDALIPEGWEASSDQIRARHPEDDSFDPSDILYAHLMKVAAESAGPQKSPWYSRLTSFLLFAAGFALLILNVKESPHQALLLFAGAVGASVLTGMWPEGVTRVLLRAGIWAVLIPLIPIAAATAAVLAVNFAPQWPLGMYGALGFSLIMLAVCKASLAASATREPRDQMARRAELARARRWLRDEVRREHPRLPTDIAPYLEALGLPVRGVQRVELTEEWGDSLVA